MKLTDTVVRRNDLVTAEMDDSLVMMDVSSGKYYNIAGAGCDIWNLIDSPKIVADVVAALRKEYNVSQAICEEQTLSFLTGMAEKGLVTVKA